MARTAKSSPRYAKLALDVAGARAEQEKLEQLRPHVPPRARVCDTELAGKLVQHTDRYKLMIDTIRVALANAESELAARLAPSLRRPTEAKKTLANLLAAPGTVHVGDDFVTLTLAPAGTPMELRAFEQLFAQLNALPLVMSGDPNNRRMRLRLQKQ